VDEASGGQNHAESVIGGVAEAPRNPAVELDDPVDGLVTAVVRYN